MSLTKLLDKIAGRHQERQQNRKADYRALVAAVADGKDPDPDLVEQILVDSNKSLDNLQTAVELLTKRRELCRTIDQQPKLQQERELIDRRIQQADAELTAAEQQHQETIHPLLCRRDEIRDALLESDRAKRELECTCADEDLLSELASTAVTRANLRTHSAELERSIAERRQRAADLYDAAEQALNSREGSTRDEAVARAEATELRARAKHNETQVPGLERQLATIRQEITVTECEESTLRDRLLVP